MARASPSAFLLFALVAVGSACADAPRAASDMYAPYHTVRAVCHQDQGSGGCFPIEADERAVALRIEDATGLPIGSYYVFRDVAGQGITEGALCGAASLVIPEGAVMLDVYPTPLAAAFPGGCAVPPTTGTIHATFT